MLLSLLISTACLAFSKVSTSMEIDHASHVNKSLPSIDKRWFSVPLTSNNPHLGVPWPRLKDVPGFTGDANSPLAQERWVRYCFASTKSYAYTFEVMLHAIARWQPAFEYSTLNIKPDLHCGKNYYCLCGPKTAKDTLRIHKSSELVQELNSDWEGPNAASLGWRGKDEGNILMFGALSSAGRNPGGLDDMRQRSAAIASLVHELGHVIGLHHEHQRPDAHASKYVTVNIENILGYDKVKERLEKDPIHDPQLPAHLNGDEKMQKICSIPALAAKYFDSCNDFMPLTRSVGNDADHHEHGVEYDYHSMMHYGSNDDAEGHGPTIVKHPSRVKKGESNNVWMGGSKNFEEKAISVLDVWRVAQLYKRDDATLKAAEAMVKRGKYEPVLAVIQDQLTSTAFPAPNFTPL